MGTTRRSFLKAATAAGVAMSGCTTLGAGKSGKRYRTALVGSGWWGMNVLHTAVEAGQSQVVALCDVDQRHLDDAATDINKRTGETPHKYKDYRDLLDKEKPEIVIVGTPDHWHPLVMIAAVKAGAHVHVEKPIGHTVYEGRAMVKAARDAGRVVQVGTHRRVSPHNMSAMRFLKAQFRQFLMKPPYSCHLKVS